jgi:hypothetical protein
MRGLIILGNGRVELRSKNIVLLVLLFSVVHLVSVVLLVSLVLLVLLVLVVSLVTPLIPIHFENVFDKDKKEVNRLPVN